MDNKQGPSTPQVSVRGCSYRGGSDFSHRRQILGQDMYLMGDCERSERLQAEIFFENDAFMIGFDTTLEVRSTLQRQVVSVTKKVGTTRWLPTVQR